MTDMTKIAVKAMCYNVSNRIVAHF